MTLWSIARSPLIMGGDLRHLDGPTKALLTNPEVIAVNQASRDNHPHFFEDGVRVWTAKATNGDTYLALFNTGDRPRDVGVDLKALGLPTSVSARDLWARGDLGKAAGRFSVQLPAHGAGLYRLA
jgi:alpha-galactosidase